MLIAYLPVLLSLGGLFVGPQLALRLNNCPHRGRVWGAFLLPLLTIVYSPLLPYALGVSFCAALAAGFTAHKPFKVSLLAAGLSGLSAIFLLQRIL